MTLIKNADLWSSKDDLILVTTNATIKPDGRLVMGRGAAKEARDKYKDLDALLGKFIPLSKFYPHYGVIIMPKLVFDNPQLGAFQVKIGYNEKARLELIKYSFDVLKTIMNTTEPIKVSMNYPGIGNGGLKESDIEPLIPDIDGLTIYKRTSTYAPNTTSVSNT